MSKYIDLIAHVEDGVVEFIPMAETKYIAFLPDIFVTYGEYNICVMRTNPTALDREQVEFAVPMLLAQFEKYSYEEAE